MGHHGSWDYDECACGASKRKVSVSCRACYTSSRKALAPATESSRFWSKVDRRGADECWNWTGSAAAGYGRFMVESQRTVQAHRFAYESLVGPIPDGLVLDHLCRNRACVNPVHLEPVTSAENVSRGEGCSALNARKTHCSHGHPYGPNTRITVEGYRICRICHNARTAARHRRRSAAARAALESVK